MKIDLFYGFQQTYSNMSSLWRKWSDNGNKINLKSEEV
jgi:hypothetical protein